MPTRTLKVINQLGIHARTASKIAALCSSYGCLVQFSKVDDVHTTANGKSIMDLLIFNAPQGTELIVNCDGEDAVELLDKLEQLFDDYFGEDH